MYFKYSLRHSSATLGPCLDDAMLFLTDYAYWLSILRIYLLIKKKSEFRIAKVWVSCSLLTLYFIFNIHFLVKYKISSDTHTHTHTHSYSWHFLVKYKISPDTHTHTHSYSWSVYMTSSEPQCILNPYIPKEIEMFCMWPFFLMKFTLTHGRYVLNSNPLKAFLWAVNH